MSIIRDEIEGDIRAVCQGIIYLDGDGILRDYDESAKNILGEYKNGDFLSVGYGEDEISSLSSFFEELKRNNKARIVTVIKDGSDKPRVVDISGKIHVRLDSSYVLKIWDITNLEAEYEEYYEELWKYRVMLGFGASTYFEYDLETKEIAFFRFVTRKAVPIYQSDFDTFCREIIEYAEATEKNISAIDNLCHRLERGYSTIETVISTALFHKDKKVQKINVQVRLDETSGHKKEIGALVAMDDTVEDVPYYMTAAGLDPMTGLLNKRSIVEYTEDMMVNPATAKKNHYMVLLDIDDFKNINDNYGHQIGDKAILLVADVLKDKIKDQGITGRFGGDEFYIFTDNINTEEKIRTILRNVRTCVTEAAKDRLGIEKLTLTMGVALFPDMGHSYKELFDLADKCLYIAKEKGKNRYVIYRPDLHQNLQIGAQRKGVSSFDEQSKAINQVVRDMFLVGRDAIGDSLNTVVKGFDLDNIDVFYGKDLVAMYDCGKYPSGLHGRDFVDNSRYMELFDGSGLYVMNNISNLKKTIPEMYNLLQKKNCMSLIQLALPNPEMPEFFVSFNMLNRVHRWSEAEISNLSLFGTLIYETILSRR